MIDRVRVCSVRVSVLAARTERNKQASNRKSAKLSFRGSSRESGAKREETEIATIVATYLVHGVSAQSGLYNWPT